MSKYKVCVGFSGNIYWWMNGGKHRHNGKHARWGPWFERVIALNKIEILRRGSLLTATRLDGFNE